MKPRNEHERRIVRLSSCLPPITTQHRKFGFEKSLFYHAMLIRKKFYCTECGHSWKAEKNHKKVTCPECGKKLLVLESLRSGDTIQSYFAILTTSAEFQVVRLICARKTIKSRRICCSICEEVMQHWIDESGKVTSMSLPVPGLSGSYDSWQWHEALSIHNNSNHYSYSAHYRYGIGVDEVYPKIELTPILKRNGYKRQIKNMPIHILFVHLLNYPIAETLAKCGQYSALRYLVREDSLHGLWPTIKVCIRHNYRIKDFSIWKDYIDLLKHFKKDTRNPKFVCPKNLKKEHDFFLERRKRQRKIEEERRRREAEERRKSHKERREREIIEFQEAYEAQKGIFFDICIKSKNLTVVVLKSIEEFKVEGERLNHCVFENEYYKRPNSLILSARLNDDPIETVEVSLSNLEILQSRGFNDNYSQHHESIVRLVNKNINQIATRRDVQKSHPHSITCSGMGINQCLTE